MPYRIQDAVHTRIVLVHEAAHAIALKTGAYSEKGKLCRLPGKRYESSHGPSFCAAYKGLAEDFFGYTDKTPRPREWRGYEEGLRRFLDKQNFGA
jgi:hypothetical protein